MTSLMAKTTAMQEKYSQKMTTVAQQKHFREIKNQNLMTKLSVSMATAEERRKANLQNKLMKVQTELEKVKNAKQKQALNKENMESNMPAVESQ